MCSGHGIISTDALAERGIPRELLEPLVATHESNRQSPSPMIFNSEGKVLRAVIGIFDLNLLEQICRDLDISTEIPYMGRGWQARDFQERITRYLDQQTIPQAFRE